MCLSLCVYIRTEAAYLNAKTAKTQSFIAIVLIHDRKLCVFAAFAFKSKFPLC